MLEVQKYLLTHSLNDLEQKYGIESSWRETNKEEYAISLNYSQIHSKPGTLTNQCRGTIISRKDGQPISSLDEIIGETIILAFPMKRFFNMGQQEADNIDFSDKETICMEKCDGSLLQCWHDPFKNEWNTATRSVPRGNNLLNDTGLNFRTLFEMALKESYNISFQEFSKRLHKDYTYCFELVGPHNKILVQYEKNDLFFLAVRNIKTLIEYNPEELTNFIGIKPVPTYKFNNMNDILNYVNNLSAAEHEGLVVRDKHFNRIKIKSPNYVLYHKMKFLAEASPRNVLELILLEKDDDIEQYLDRNIHKKLKEMKERLNLFIQNQDNIFQECKELSLKEEERNQRKTFALSVQAKKNSWMAAQISIFLNKSKNCLDYIQQQKRSDANSPWSESFMDNLIEMINKV